MKKKKIELPNEIMYWLDEDKCDYTLKTIISMGFSHEIFDEVSKISHNKFVLVCDLSEYDNEPLQRIFERLFIENSRTGEFLSECFKYKIVKTVHINGRFIAHTTLQIMEDGTIGQLTV